MFLAGSCECAVAVQVTIQAGAHLDHITVRCFLDGWADRPARVAPNPTRGAVQPLIGDPPCCTGCAGSRCSLDCKPASNGDQDVRLAAGEPRRTSCHSRPLDPLWLLIRCP